AAEDAKVAVFVFPRNELAFSGPGTVSKFFFPVNFRFAGNLRGGKLKHAPAIFRKNNKKQTKKNHKDLEFSDGRIVLLTRLSEGQEATVLQLPAQPTTAAEAVAHKRIAYVG